jgi:hypothetical protein
MSLSYHIVMRSPRRIPRVPWCERPQEYKSFASHVGIYEVLIRQSEARLHLVRQQLLSLSPRSVRTQQL